jgi:hypothetical protein
VPLVVTALLAARSASADEPEPEILHDTTAFPTPSTRLPLVGMGAATTLVWYGGALAGAYLYPTANGADELKIPFAGPWMSLAQTGCPSTTPDCSTFWMVVGGIMKGFSGIGQAGGLFLMIEGLFLPTMQPKTSAERARWNLTPHADVATAPALSRVVVFPTSLPGGAGLGVAGLF